MKTKKKRRESGNDAEQNSQRLHVALKKLGLASAYAELPSWFRRVFPKNFDLKPKFVFEEPIDPTIKAFVPSFQRATKNGVSFYDYLEILTPLCAHLKMLLEQASRKNLGVELAVKLGVRRSLSTELPVQACEVITGTIDRLIDELTQELLSALTVACIEISSLEGRFYLWRLNELRCGKRHRLQLTFTSGLVQEERVIIDELMRRVFRVGGFQVVEEGVDWGSVELDCGKDLSSETPGDFLPVYIQPHTLQRMKERLDEPKIWKLFSYSIFHSLKNGRGIDTGGPDFLVPFVMGTPPIKLGYLVVTKLSTMFVIRTFLFLTMEGTPEGDKLRWVMRWRRADRDYYKLDCLSTFLNTDLIDSEVFSQCLVEGGLEDFVDWLRSYRRDRVIRPFAGELIKHFRLDRGSRIVY
jgi:hypothetical protein